MALSGLPDARNMYQALTRSFNIQWKLLFMEAIDSYYRYIWLANTPVHLFVIAQFVLCRISPTGPNVLSFSSSFPEKFEGSCGLIFYAYFLEGGEFSFCSSFYTSRALQEKFLV